MAVATITLESSNGDSVVVSAPDDAFLVDDIVLDTDPQGMYDTGFKVRTVSGAFEQGGRIVGESVPIREPILPFWLTPASRPRFQRLWGSPGNFHKVWCHWDGPSGRRSLMLKLAKEIQYTTEDGFDADIDKTYHAVVSALAVNPMYEGVETGAQWTNPNARFDIDVVATGGTLRLTYGTAPTLQIAYPATPGALQTALETVAGPGKVTVTGSPGDYTAVFTDASGSALTGSASNLTGTGKKVTITQGWNTGWFEVWNPTDQFLWPEWEFDPAQWQFPDFGFGQERKWNRPVGSDAARMIVTPVLTQLLSVMSDPMMDTYVSADLSNAAGLFNGVEPVYPVPPYTGTEDEPILMPVLCKGPAGARATLRQRRFWSAESGLEA